MKITLINCCSLYSAKMLLIIAKQYHAKGDTAKALVYADSALKMFDTAIAQQPSAEAYRYQSIST